MQQVLVIDNHDSFVYNLVQLLKNSGLCRFDVVMNDRIDLGQLSRYTRILLSPGPGLPEEAGQLMELLNCCRETHPILGVCLGHQAIAQLFGGKLIQMAFPRHGHESVLNITDSQDILYKGIDNGIKIGRYHSWVVSPENFPEELKISSLDEDGNIMSFYHKSLLLHGVQFHPESIISEYGQRMIDNWLSE